MRLAIVGDTHYLNPAYHRRELAGQTRSTTAPADVRRHTWTTQHVLPRLVEELRAASPDVVLQLGDVVQGHGDDDAGDRAELHECADFLAGIGRPLLFARGTHEGRPGSAADATYRERFLREVARTLGEPPGSVDTSYAFAAGGCRVVVLDYTTFQSDGPADRLLHAELDTAAQRGERMLVCGHPPLVPIGRPFFTRLEYAPAVLARLAASPAPVDAYFCGHTPDQVATLHRLETGFSSAAVARGLVPRQQPLSRHVREAEGEASQAQGASGTSQPHQSEADAARGWLPQFQSVPVGYPAMAPVPLSAVRPLLPSPESVRYGWGYLEDSAPGWFLVEIDGDGVRVDWRCVGQEEPAGKVRWTDAGAPEFSRIPETPATAPLPAWPIEPGDPRVIGVRLRAAGIGSRAPHRVFLNKRDAGILPPLDYFDARQGLAIPEAYWDSIRTENHLLIRPVEAEERCLGGFVLEITLAGGTVLRSEVTPELYATSAKWDPWRWCTPNLRRIAPLDPLRLPLNFGA